MSAVLASDTVQDLDGNVLSEVRWLDDGTVERYEAGRLVESREQTGDEAERFAPAPLTTEEKVDVLLEAMDQAATYAQLRAVIREALS